MSELAFGITACTAWTPGRETWREWCAWAGVELPASVEEAAVPPMLLRRRVSPLGQKALKAAWSMPNLPDACYVFASRHGEFDRTTALLRSVARREEASPADFSLSVHNALTGLLSIATRNRRGHTTITAGGETFCFGLLEGAVRVAASPAVPAILVFYDAPLISPYDELMAATPEHPEPLVVVLTIGPMGQGRWNIRQSMQPANGAASTAPALDFLKFLLPGAGHGQSAGRRFVWQWRHD